MPGADQPFRFHVVQRAQDPDGDACLREGIIGARSRGGEQRDRLGFDPARDEPEHLRGGVIDPLQVVHGCEQPAVGGRVREQLKRRHRDQEHLKRRAVQAAECGKQRIALPWRERGEAVGQRVEELVQPGERYARLRLDAYRSQHDAAVARGGAARLLQQRRLADAGPRRPGAGPTRRRGGVSSRWRTTRPRGRSGPTARDRMSLRFPQEGARFAQTRTPAAKHVLAHFASLLPVMLLIPERSGCGRLTQAAPQPVRGRCPALTLAMCAPRAFLTARPPRRSLGDQASRLTLALLSGPGLRSGYRGQYRPR